jgi:hypothetical protein
MQSQVGDGKAMFQMMGVFAEFERAMDPGTGPVLAPLLI